MWLVVTSTQRKAKMNGVWSLGSASTGIFGSVVCVLLVTLWSAAVNLVYGRPAQCDLRELSAINTNMLHDKITLTLACTIFLWRDQNALQYSTGLKGFHGEFCCRVSQLTIRINVLCDSDNTSINCHCNFFYYSCNLKTVMKCIWDSSRINLGVLFYFIFLLFL